MKRHLISAISLIAAVLSLSACVLKDEFTMENVSDFINVTDEGVLVNDNGLVYNLTTDASDGLWRNHPRFYCSFDVLNSNFDIMLRNYIPAVVENMTDTSADPDMEGCTWLDPVVVLANGVSGGYVNIIANLYRDKNSAYDHKLHMYYVDDDVKDELHLYLVHDGNGENPVLASSDASLESFSAVYSFSLKGIVPEGNSRTVFINFKTIDNSDPKSAKIVDYNGRLYDILTF